MKKIILITLIAFSAFGATAKSKKADYIEDLSQSVHSHFDKAPDGPLTEVVFSPEAGSEQLALKIINASQHSIRLAAYSFTSPAVVRGLLKGKKRGLDIRVIVDDKGNRSQKSIAALNLLVNAFLSCV